MHIESFFDSNTCTFSYIVYDEKTRDAAIIDPVLDFDPLNCHITKKSISRIENFVEKNGLIVHWVLDTHAHADHLSGCWEIKKRFNCRSAIGHRMSEVRAGFSSIYNRSLSTSLPWDRLVRHGEKVEAGALTFEVRETPGHTPSCVSYLIEDAIFVGDALFMPELGCGRCDFPGGSAPALYRSILDQIYSLPKENRIFTGHDYPKNDEQARCETSVALELTKNVMINSETKETEFVHAREARDKNLPLPKLLYFSMQVNIDGGRLPAAEENGQRYLKIPCWQES